MDYSVTELMDFRGELEELLNYPNLKVLDILLDDVNISDYLPCDLNELSINSDVFNMKLERLPVNLKKLYIFCDNFNQELDNLPEGLKKLYIYSNKFNQELENLPEGLEVLYIYSDKFNQELKKLPKNLKTLSINFNEYDKKIYNLPESLENLNFKNNIEIEISYPLYLKTLKIYGNYNNRLDNLPENLIELEIYSDNFNQELDTLPENLEKLYIMCNVFEKDLEILPKNLKELTLYGVYDKEIKWLSKEGKLGLHLSNIEEYMKNNILNVKKLYVYDIVLHSIKDNIPLDLEELYIRIYDESCCISIEEIKNMMPIGVKIYLDSNDIL